ncbi:MAG TPA: thiamine pyrophosphate-dependent enzyme [Acidimicrobiales bacterium]|nr:thiamine pyrophosphate-dependent enzyme [Acidimicrobiales bacterium]
MAEDLDALEDHLLGAVGALSTAPPEPATVSTDLGPDGLRALWDAQVGSRLLDHTARWLRGPGLGFYTIGSAGHESNAAVALALRPTDPALLHYRSGGFYLARAGQVPGHDGVRDVLLGLTAAAEEPIAGGRHKVFGHRDLAVIPQTSTIASHLPRAVGVAFAIDRARKLDVAGAWPADAIVVCSFGDASANHATALAAFNTAGHCAHQHLPLPLLFVCEDNGIGISVRTPPGWVEEASAGRAGLRYASADGTDPAGTFTTARELAAWVRATRRPAFLHLRTVRYLGHAGTDVEAAYRTPAELRDDLARDPLLGTARLLVAAGVAEPHELVAGYLARRARLREQALDAAALPPLRSPTEVMAPLAPRRPAAVRTAVADHAPGTAATTADATGAADGAGMTLAQAVNHTLGELLDRYPQLLVFGEDVAAKGGVYGVTRGLLQRAGAGRVFDTVLDETSVLGLALGAAITGLLPVPEIQYLAYLHNAEDQLRGEAATLSFFSTGQYRNGMVVRVQGYAYQKGFGGHFHNDNALGVLRDIPGLVIASPARPDDAAAMLRTCVAAAHVDGTVSVFLEPIALYHERDLHEPGDGGWLAAPGPPADHAPLGAGRVHGAGQDLTIVTWANGLRMSLRAARRLAARGVEARVLDLRWLAPLPLDDLLREAAATGSVLVADETRATGGVSEGVVTALVDAGFGGRIARVASADSFIPLGDAAHLVLLSEGDIEAAALRLVGIDR